MKQLKFLSTLGIAFVFLFSSCSGDEGKTTDTATTADTTATTPTTQSTVDTTPQTILVVWHKVADFAKWKTSYDGHDSMRLAGGIHNYVIGRSVEDSNMILVATKADDVAKAKAFIKDPSLKAAMQKGGVTGAPSISINTVVYQDQAQNMSPLRSMTMFKVKDWNAWKTAFESNRQLRTDNGLTDRAYGYDPDDNHKVILVVAINDTAKANAYWNSDLIKQKRAESGVVGEVKRYVYRVAQRY
ncbi:MAG: hypothetical protein JWO92_841 [Chitinophagaceae bacterium]|nr:hypothetical protein [Chitinophagaceae bacterium]MDB5221865.1 hypothetical protein [Chitinophagaceae bacterium]